MRKNKLILNLTLIALCLNACQSSPVGEEATTAEAAQNAASARTLTICLGYEPDSLYPYAASSQAAKDVLQAIYDGPVDELDGQAVPVILTSIPNLENGGVVYEPVSVTAGDMVVDSSGDAVSLQAGTKVFPSGCAQSACIVAWDGESPLMLDQPGATFELIEGINWSDGQALTAADSVYSYELAADADTPGEKTLVEQTRRLHSPGRGQCPMDWPARPGQRPVQRLFLDAASSTYLGRYPCGRAGPKRNCFAQPAGLRRLCDGRMGARGEYPPGQE